jgi:hypothetical protein
MTINKAQAQAYKQAGIYPPLPVFPSGKLNVAFYQSSSFDNNAVVSTDGHWQCTENDW